jgi:hypothetical protein
MGSGQGIARDRKGKIPFHGTFTVARYPVPVRWATATNREGSMERERGWIHLLLTPDQQEAIRRATGVTAEALTLRPEELEERIAPGMAYRPWHGLD